MFSSFSLLVVAFCWFFKKLSSCMCSLGVNQGLEGSLFTNFWLILPWLPPVCNLLLISGHPDCLRLHLLTLKSYKKLTFCLSSGTSCHLNWGGSSINKPCKSGSHLMQLPFFKSQIPFSFFLPLVYLQSF